MCVIKTIQELCCSEFGYVLTQLLCECYFFMRIIFGMFISSVGGGEAG